MGINEFIDVDLGCHAKGSIIISDEAATQVETYGSGALQLEVVLVLKGIDDGLGILGCNGNIIHVYGDVFVDIVFALHPDIGLCLTWLEAHIDLSATICELRQDTATIQDAMRDLCEKYLPQHSDSNTLTQSVT